jgi:lipase
VFDADSITINGVQIHLACRRGVGESLVLIHGLTDSAACWGRVVAALGSYHDIVAYDVRGHGRSGAPDGQYELQDHARDLIGVIEQLRLDSVTLVGHSLGAEIAALVASSCHDLVSALVIEDPPWHKDWVGFANARRQMAAKTWRQWIEHLQRLSLAEVVQIGRTETPHWDDIDILTWASSKHELRLQALDSVLAHRPAWQSVVAGLSCPTLLVIGDARLGGLVSQPMADEARRLSSSVEVAHVQGAGHGVHRDRFDDYVALLRQFLRR